MRASQFLPRPRTTPTSKRSSSVSARGKFRKRGQLGRTSWGSQMEKKYFASSNFELLVSRGRLPRSPHIRFRVRLCFSGPSFSAGRSARSLSGWARSRYRLPPNVLRSAFCRVAALWIFRVPDLRMKVRKLPRRAPLLHVLLYRLRAHPPDELLREGRR